MFVPHIQIEWNHWRIASVRPYTTLRIIPEPDAPRGRKARWMADAWTLYREMGAVGILWQDPDIVVDPDDMDEMEKAINRSPEFVHCSVHKLWPASTMRESWVWAHGVWKDNAPVMGQRTDIRADWFALGFTYTPARLLDLAHPHMFQWVFGQVDSGLAAIARQHRIPAFPVPKCRPKHLHFYPREDDASWRPGMASGPPAT
jgi:hypothetical protein